MAFHQSKFCFPDSFSGILFIDKPQGITSHDVVDRVRRTLGMKRVGHAGTLDPMATGLLIILVGQATKVSQFLMGLDKTYAGTLKLGETTDSHDADGQIVSTRPIAGITAEKLTEVMKTFVGDQYQLPPMFSAKKQHGQTLYKLARQGIEVEREPRFIRISSLTIQSIELPFAAFEVACSKGTYIRTLAHDIGEKLGCGAHLTTLRRTAIDKFQVTDSITLENFEALDEAGIRAAVKPTFQIVPARVLGGK
jgi:tRNA pseudouridine55 synthase